MCHQVVDTGVDETSCFFADGDGDQLEHGYFYDEVGFALNATSSTASWLEPSEQVFTSSIASWLEPSEQVFTGGDFSFDLSRRKVSRRPSID